MKRFAKKHPNVVLGLAAFWLALAPIAINSNVKWILARYATFAWRDFWRSQQGLFDTATALCFPVGLVMLLAAALQGFEICRLAPSDQPPSNADQHSSWPTETQDSLPVDH